MLCKALCSFQAHFRTPQARDFIYIELCETQPGSIANTGRGHTTDLCVCDIM